MHSKKYFVLFFAVCLFVLILGLIACSSSDDIDLTDSSDITAESTLKDTQTTSDSATDKNPESTNENSESTTADGQNSDNSQTSSLNVDMTKKGTISSKNKDINKSVILFNNQKYYFPIIAKNFFNKSWSCNGKTCDKSILKNIGNNLVLSHSSGEKIKVQEVYAFDKENNYQPEILINRIVLEGTKSKNSTFWVLPGGITAQSTAADVIAVYGNTNGNKNFSKCSYNSENKISYSSQKKSGISYVFTFNSDGSIDSVEVSVSKKKLQTPVVYKNEYFSVSLPGYWRGRFYVDNSSPRHFEFRFIEGGHIFTVYLLSKNEPFEYHANNILFGTISKSGTSFDAVFETPSDYPVEENFSAEYDNLIGGININVLSDCLSAAGDYSYKKVNYSKYKGKTYAEEFDTHGYYLDIENVNFSEITFSYSYVSNTKINVMENVSVVMSHGKGYFDYAEDGWGNLCEGYIRLDGDTAYVSITSDTQPGTYFTLNTNGEKKLPKFVAESTTKEEPTEEKTTQKETTEPFTQSNKKSKLVVDSSIKKHINWTVADLENAYGTDYTIEEFYLKYTDDVVFHLAMGNNISDATVYVIYLTGDYNIGHGLTPNMTGPEVLEAFGVSPDEQVEPGYDGTYFLKKEFDGYAYSYVWYSDFNAVADYVCIGKQ